MPHEIFRREDVKRALKEAPAPRQPLGGHRAGVRGLDGFAAQARALQPPAGGGQVAPLPRGLPVPGALPRGLPVPGAGARAAAPASAALLPTPPGLVPPAQAAPAHAPLLAAPPGLDPQALAGAGGGAAAAAARAAGPSGKQSHLAGTHNALKRQGGKNVLFGQWKRLLDAVKSFERAHARAPDTEAGRAALRARLDALVAQVEQFRAAHADSADPNTLKRMRATEILLPRLRHEQHSLADGLGHGMNEKTREGDTRVLGAGAVNTVKAASFRGAGGELSRGVFKGDQYLGNAASPHKGENDRAVAASIADKMIGTNVLVDTQYSSLEGELGIIMAMAPGQEAEQEVAGGEGALGSLDVDHNDPELQRQLVALQWIDALTGETDRHGGNFMINQGEGIATKLTGIDNDGAFNPQVASDIGLSLPNVVDAQLLEHMRGCDEAAFLAALRPVLNDEQLDFARERFQIVKQHMEDLAARGQIVGAEGGALQWGGEGLIAATTHMDANGRPTNRSYLEERDMRTRHNPNKVANKNPPRVATPAG